MILLKRDRPVPGTVVAANPAARRSPARAISPSTGIPASNVALARRFSGGTILEARYFGVDSTDTNDFVTPGNFIGAGFTGPGGTSFTGKYLSMLDSTEINLRRAVNDRLVAARRLPLGRAQGRNVLQAQRQRRDRRLRVQQPALRRPARRQLQRRCGPRAAGLRTSKPRRASTATSPTAASSSSRATTSSAPSSTATRPTSFVGELDFTLGYRLTQHVVLRSGYQLLWLDRVALAGDAASRSLLNPSLLRDIDYNDLFYQGATTGIDVAW